MNKMFKYTFGSECRINIPSGAVVRKIAVQHNTPTVWAEVECPAPGGHRTIVAIWTGDTCPRGATYLDTLFTDNGMVWHIYELDTEL